MRLLIKKTLLGLLLTAACILTVFPIPEKQASAETKEFPKAFEELLHDKIHNDITALASLTQQFFEQTILNIQLLAGSPDIHSFLQEPETNPDAPKIISAKFKAACTTYPYLLRVDLLDATGLLLASSESPLVGRDYRDLADFQQVLMKADFSIGSAFKSAVNGNTVIRCSGPVVIDGTIRGVLICLIDLDYCYNRFFIPYHIGENGFAFILNSDRQIIAHKDKSLLFTESQFDKGTHEQIEYHNNVAIELENSQGGSTIYYFEAEPELGLTIVIQVDREDLANTYFNK